MAFVVRRPKGRYEIRESIQTDSGPRARTLASFRVLTTDVIDRAAAVARTRFDAERVRARAKALGAPERDANANRAAQALLRELRRGGVIAPALAHALRDAVPDPAHRWPDTLDGAIEWLGKTPADHGRALHTLMNFASHVPQRRRPRRSNFPRIDSHGLA
jgi:hypothetical protein